MRHISFTLLLLASTLLLQGCGRSNNMNSFGGGFGGGGYGGGMGGGDSLGSVASLVRGITGQSAAQTGARSASSSLINSLNNLETQLRWIASPQVGMNIYNALNNATAQITGQASNLPPLTTRYPSVNVVQTQIAELKNIIQSREAFLDQMTPQQINQYTMQLQSANNTVSSATTMASQNAGPGNGMMYNPMMGGGSFTHNMENLAGMAAGQAIYNRLSGNSGNNRRG